MQPTNCRALLTGASGGIGLALAHRLASEGAHLLLVGRRLEPLQPLLQRFPQNVLLVQADIASRSGRDALVAAAQNFGGDPKKMDAYLESIGSSAASLKRQIEGEVAWENLLRRAPGWVCGQLRACSA